MRYLITVITLCLFAAIAQAQTAVPTMTPSPVRTATVTLTPTATYTPTATPGPSVTPFATPTGINTTSEATQPAFLDALQQSFGFQENEFFECVGPPTWAMWTVQTWSSYIAPYWPFPSAALLIAVTLIFIRRIMRLMMKDSEA